jgi:hypothetical protein
MRAAGDHRQLSFWSRMRRGRRGRRVVSLFVLGSFVLALVAALQIAGAGASTKVLTASGQRAMRHAAVDPHRGGEGKPKPFRVPAHEERNEDKGRKVPLGPRHGNLRPANKGVVVRRASGPRFRASAAARRTAASVSFTRNTSFKSNVSFSGVPPDMSGADGKETVLATGNTFGAVSTDNGSTFTSVNPTNIWPSGPSKDSSGAFLDKGLCCDQVIQYVPKVDRWIWLMQFCGAGSSCLQGRNKIRIAAMSTSSVRSGFPSWTYWDLTSATFGLDGTSNPNMDYPNLAVGDNFLYMSVDRVGPTGAGKAGGLLVARIPLAEIAASATIHIDFTTPSDSGTAYGGHVTQDVGDTEYWAGHVSNSQLRVFSMKEGEGVYRWRDVDVSSWCNGDRSSTTPGGSNDWLAFGFPGNAVIGSALRGSEIWFAWTAGHKLSNGNSCGFDQSHVEIVVIDAGNYSKKAQMQVWNKTIAFAYADLASNTAGEIGMSLGYAGASTEMNHAVGFWGDFVVYSTTASTSSDNRFGDYVTIRRSSDGRRFSAEGYGKTGTPAGFDPRYVLFGR